MLHDPAENKYSSGFTPDQTSGNGKNSAKDEGENSEVQYSRDSRDCYQIDDRAPGVKPIEVERQHGRHSQLCR